MGAESGLVVPGHKGQQPPRARPVTSDQSLAPMVCVLVPVCVCVRAIAVNLFFNSLSAPMCVTGGKIRGRKSVAKRG